MSNQEEERQILVSVNKVLVVVFYVGVFAIIVYSPIPYLVASMMVLAGLVKLITPLLSKPAISKPTTKEEEALLNRPAPLMLGGLAIILTVYLRDYLL